MSWITVDNYRFPGGWTNSNTASSQAKEYCRQLEAGKILYFNQPPYDLPDEDRQFLLGQKQSTFRGHKNISYRPKTDQLRGAATETPADTQRLQEIMRRFSQHVVKFVDSFLSPYASKRQLDFASFRSLEEKNREATLTKRNDLLHVDAFPTRPTHGGRILRVFININPTENRIWQVTAPFKEIAPKYASAAQLNKIASPTASEKLMASFAPLLKAVGVKGADRSPYDRFMLHFHDFLKGNDEYQQNYPKQTLEFPPNSVWLVYTDTVPHAVLSGRFAMEQTFIVPASAMVAPESSPICVLEQLCGKTLATKNRPAAAMA